MTRTHLLHRLVTLVIAVIIRIAIIAITITVIAVVIVVAARIASTTGEEHAGALGELGFGLDLLALVIGRSEGLLVRGFRIGTATEEGHGEVVCGFGFEEWCGSCLVVSSLETFFLLFLFRRVNSVALIFLGRERVSGGRESIWGRKMDLYFP
jgi:hypothetical protein